MQLSSSDLELTYDAGGNQAIGLRFTGIDIPQGAYITNAYIEFETDEISSDPTALVIAIEDTDNAGQFSTTSYDVSSRNTAPNTVAWNDIPA